MCLDSIAKNFTIDNMKKIGLKGSLKDFFVDYNAIDTSNILDIHRYLMKKTWYKTMFRFIKICLLDH